MKTNKKVLLIKNIYDDYVNFLMKIIANKICIKNLCELVEVDANEYNDEFGKIEIPSIVMVKNNKVIDILSGFRYLDKVPKM